MWTVGLWAVALALFAAVGVMWWRERTQDGRGYPYARRDRLMSPVARQFLRVLDEAAGADYRVFAQVHVPDVVRITRRPQTPRFDRALRRIDGHHFDFVLCDRETLAVACVVLLEEPSTPSAEAGEPFLTGLCRVAGVPLVRVVARRDYDLHDLGQRLTDAIDSGRSPRVSTEATVTMAGPGTPAPAVAGAPMRSAGVDARGDDTAPRSGASVPERRASVLTPTLMASLTRSHGDAAEGAPPTCPRCGARMVRRHVSIGSHPGGEFWGCSRFPLCRAMLPILNSQSSAG